MLTTPMQVIFLRKITLLIVQIDAGFLVIVMLLTFFFISKFLSELNSKLKVKWPEISSGFLLLPFTYYNCTKFVIVSNWTFQRPFRGRLCFFDLDNVCRVSRHGRCHLPHRLARQEEDPGHLRSDLLHCYPCCHVVRIWQDFAGGSEILLLFSISIKLVLIKTFDIFSSFIIS